PLAHGGRTPHALLSLPLRERAHGLAPHLPNMPGSALGIIRIPCRPSHSGDASWRPAAVMSQPLCRATCYTAHIALKLANRWPHAVSQAAYHVCKSGWANAVIGLATH